MIIIVTAEHSESWFVFRAPLQLALVVIDPDAVGGLYVHWIVTGIAGSGSTADGQTPAGGLRAEF